MKTKNDNNILKLLGKEDEPFEVVVAPLACKYTVRLNEAFSHSSQFDQIVDTLVKVMEDKNADPKTKESAASNVLRHLSTMAEQKNKDEIARKVAEIRIRGSKGMGTTVDEDTGPLLDFDNIDERFANQEPLEVEYTETEIENEEGT